MRQLRATAARPRLSCCWLLCQTDVMLASSQRRWWNPNQSPRTCQTEAWRLRGSASRLRRLCFPSSTCKCFMSRWVGVCEYSYMLMNPILLFCSTFIFLLHSPPETPADTALELHLCRLSVCAVKGQTETRAHCELIPVKCLLCLCNGFQPAAPHCERMGVCVTWSHKRKSAWKFHIQRKVEAHQ